MVKLTYHVEYIFLIFIIVIKYLKFPTWISLSGMDIRKFAHTTSHKMISHKGYFFYTYEIKY